MSYVLATTETRVRWYVFPIRKLEDITALKQGDYELSDLLDLSLVQGFGTKETAKRVALAVGLKTWRYVKVATPAHTFTLA